jgi:hypothetical protein
MGIVYEDVNSNAVVKDSDLGLAHRWYDAYGGNVCKFLEEFVNVPFSGADQMAGWLTTLIENGGAESTSALVAGSAGGEIIFTADIGDNDGLNAQVLGEAFSFAARYPTYFGCRFKLAEVLQCDAAAGLIITDTTVLLDGASDGLYFRKNDGLATLYLVAEKDNAETVIGVATLANNTYVTAEYLYTGGVVHVYINGIWVAELADSDPNFPDDEFLTPSLCLLTGEAVNVKTMTTDWIRAISIQAA